MNIAAASLLVLVTLVVPPLKASDHAAPGAGLAGPAALDRLLAGNRRYASAETGTAQPVARQRAANAQTQHPFAIVVTCSDSRVAPEIVFDQGLGELFVIRTAGHVVADYGLGSIEYAVAHLGVKLVVVLSHERCGAVSAAVAGGEAPGHLKALVEAILPAVRRTQASADPVDAAVAENARTVARQIRDTLPAVAELARANVKVVAARYDLDTGIVTLVE